MIDGSDRRSFARFDAAMNVARDANAPQFGLYDDTPAAVDAPAVSRDLPWRALRGPGARRLGIGGAVGLAAALLLTMLTPLIGAAIGWRLGPESPPEQAAAAAPADAVATAPEPAAGPDDPPSLPVLADDALAAAAQKVAAAPAARVRVTGLDAAARPRAGALPVPSFKPSPAGR